MNEFQSEMRLRVFEDTLDALIEMKERAQSESEDDRIDNEIAVLISEYADLVQEFNLHRM